ncbi:dihydroorotase [Modicisalibacter ilicicola DSM 19980]|uniref:Dihydroorotase n=1 Tax=Modicisalibacter ilicicola DSM 19980 TaxID=1121942 RepID=A0A1M5AAC1_9GAMM|nr:dihydroorotase [Halomonas ilicicola]SHF27114.1 dihydroorotase [Halomonas ilicicola DSM 19980]
MSADRSAVPASVLLAGARLIDPASGLDRQADLAILDGRIVASEHPEARHLPRRDVSGCVITPGLVDIGAHLREPGPRYKGSLDSESAAALAGGYTRVAPRPDTSPVLDSAAHIRTLCDRAAEVDGVRLIPLGALTQGLEGRLLANMAGLKGAGCVALTNLRAPLADTRVLRRCLEYAATYDMPVLFHPEDAALAAGGCAHEGSVASRLGLGGIPATAETAALAQWLLLIEQTGVRAHAAHLSCARSVLMIEQAKQQGLPVTCDVTLAHLHWSDAAVEGFDTLFHLQPPLRTLADRNALRDGVRRGVIDAIVSGHLPHEQAAKMAPFAASEPGMSSLETAWAQGQALVDERAFDLPALVACLTSGPARVLGLPPSSLQPGHLAELAVFDPQRTWTPNDETLRSAGLNTPLLGQTLKGRCLMTLVAGQIGFEGCD